MFLTCRYRAWRFPITYSHIATTQSLAIVSIASHIAKLIYMSAASGVLIKGYRITEWPGYVHTWITHNTESNYLQVHCIYLSACALLTLNMYCKEWWRVCTRHHSLQYMFNVSNVHWDIVSWLARHCFHAGHLYWKR